MSFDDLASGDMTTPAPGGGGGAFDVRKLLGTLLRFYWIPLFAIGLGLVVAFIYAKTMKPVYRSSAEIKAERRSTAAGPLPDSAALEGATTPEDLRTIEQSFVSAMLMKRVVAKLNLTQRPGIVARGAAPAGEDRLIGYLLDNTEVELVTDTRLIRISFESWNPVLAQEIANAVVDEGLAFDREQRVDVLDVNVKYLKEEATRLERNLSESEEKLNAYTRKSGSVSINDELDIVASQLRDLNSRHTVAKAERLKLESDYEQIQAVKDDAEKLLSIESIRKVPAVERLYVRTGELKSQFLKLAQKYRPQHPAIIQTETEIKEVEQNLKQEILQAPRSIEVALTSARRNEENLGREEAEQEKRVLEIRDMRVKSQVLQRQIDADRVAYEMTLRKLNEESAQARSQPVLLQLVKPAGLGYRTSVRGPKVLGMGFAVGAMLGLGLIVLIAQLDSSTKTAEDAEKVFHLSVLSTIPEYTVPEPEDAVPAKSRRWNQRLTGGAKAIREKLATAGLDQAEEWMPMPGRRVAVPPDIANSPLIKDRRSTVAEAFMSLRSAIQLVEGSRSSLILITSSVAGEGKSFCALNLGVALAQTGQRTLLVDSQLRRPVLEERIFAAKGGNGLADYLQGEVNFSSVIRATSIPNFDVVTAGSPSRHPGEILSRQRFRDFLDSAQSHYDRVVFDSSAVSAVSDTLSYAKFFPLVCLVLRAGRTPRGAVQRAMELLGRAGAKPYGLVLNFASVGNSSSGSVFEPEKELDFPKTCPSCGRVFVDLEDYMHGTTAAKSGAPLETSRLSRACRQCGTPVVVAADNRRDLSESGLHRRNAFGDLLGKLINAGMSADEARAKLLLTLKIGRHETFNGDSDNTTGAGRRRHHLFEELLGQLTKTGLSRDDAKTRLLKAIQDWRGVP